MEAPRYSVWGGHGGCWLAAGVVPTMGYCNDTAAVPVEPGDYWVMIHTGDTAGVVRYYYDGPPNWYGNTDTFADGASDTFGVGGAGEGTLSIRVDYYPESEARLAGRTAVGTRVSGAMSANYKRGSSFVLTESAEVLSLNAYLDGLGGTSDAVPLWISLYRTTSWCGPAALQASRGITRALTAITGMARR